MKTVLFVCYGSGHVQMVLPVAKALASSGMARPLVLALTTAAPVVRAAGLEMVQFKDFITAKDDAALAHGRRLMADMPAVVDADETAAYLGLCYAELEEDLGEAEALRRYQRDGRQAFLPRRVLLRIVRQLAPDVVFATNSPRAERAAIEAARALGLPSICLVDLFCIDEVQWIGSPDYADRVCVLNDSVRRFLVTAGRREDQVVVTGNPAFDGLLEPVHVVRGRELREQRKWNNRRVLLWPQQVESPVHPVSGKAGDVHLPAKALQQVCQWVLSHTDAVLCIRPRAGGSLPDLPADPRIVVTGQDIGLPTLLNAVDLVVTLNSTVGLEGHLAGLPVVQVLGSLFDDSMPLKAHGLADEAVAVAHIGGALDRCFNKSRRPTRPDQSRAASRVLDVLAEFL